jgi:hypothetical protein
MTAGDQDPGEEQPPTPFEEFTSGGDWRSLPLKIKLMVLKLWRAEHDVPADPPTQE